MAIEKFPLQWPISYKRTRWPEMSRFDRSLPFGKARDEMFHQANLLLDSAERKSIILSTNIPLRLDGIPYANYRQPDDKGVALYFTYKKKDVVLCCDKWNKVEHNIWAIAKTVEAMRGIERWGVSDFLEHSFSGFQALPPKAEDQPKRSWWLVMDYQQRPGNMSWDWAGVEAQYKSLAKKRHPDMPGGSTALFQELQTAFEEAKKYFNK